MYSRILVPVDLDHTEKLDKALDLAGRTAQQTGAKVVYTDVVDAVPTMTARTEGERYADRLGQLATEQSKRFDIETDGEIALRSDLHLNVGSDIVKTAIKTDCDLIVMASHVPGLKDHILSSNAGYVAAHAPMSVYVVR
ncbi:MAG: universal stress protein [Pseudomonadota bacterium]